MISAKIMTIIHRHSLQLVPRPALAEVFLHRYSRVFSSLRKLENKSMIVSLSSPVDQVPRIQADNLECFFVPS